MSLKMNLQGGVASLAQFAGIGKGIAAPKPAARRVEPFVGIGAGRAVPRADSNDTPPPSDGGEQDDGSDLDPGDDALEDDDYGEDAPSDDDTPEEADMKRASRRARKARRLKSQPADPPADQAPNPPPDPDPPENSEDDDPDTEMRGNSPAAQARRRERARCASIFAHKAAAQNPDLAAHLAFNTSMTRREAVGALARGGAPKSGLLAGAMAGYAAQRPGAAPPERSKGQHIAANWDSIFAEAVAYRTPKK